MPVYIPFVALMSANKHLDLSHLFILNQQRLKE